MNLWLFSSENGFVSVNFRCSAWRGVGKSLGETGIVSMYLLGFDAAVIPNPKGGSLRGIEVINMVTFDVAGLIFYSQAVLFIALFFTVQTAVLFASVKAPDVFDKWADWVVYKGTWLGLFIQCITMAVLALLVFNTPTDSERVGWTVLLAVANTVWFASLRGVFLFADYKHSRSVAQD